MSDQSSLLLKPKLTPLIAIGAIVAVIGAASLIIVIIGGMPEAPPLKLLERARTEQNRGRFAEAERLALRAAELDPSLEQAAILAGECAASQFAWPRALENFGRVQARDPHIQLSVRLREAEILHHQLYLIARAERAYRDALLIDPNNREANKGLVLLLALCGRTREAQTSILRLIQQNEKSDTLFLLSRSDMTVGSPQELNQARQADRSDPNPHIGLAWHAFQSERYGVAERFLRTAIQLDPRNRSARIMLGRILLANNRPTEFSVWSRTLPTHANEVSDLWLIRAQMAEELGDLRGAVRCYWESLRIAPESKLATFRLDHCLNAVSDFRAVEPLRQRIQIMQSLEEMQNRALFGSEGKRPEFFLPLALAYESAGRLWEAYGWVQYAINNGTKTQELTEHLDRLKQRLQDEPLQLVSDAASIITSIDLSSYPVPEFDVPLTESMTSQSTSNVIPSFNNDASKCGLDFQYFNGVKGAPTHRMFEFTGGGIGVLDFDLDQYPDLFLTQGCQWPRGTPDVSGGDRLFRNHAGLRFEEISQSAGIVEAGFGQGIAVGDFNSDGFPDVYVANIGRNQFWQNQGDGTFIDITSTTGVVSDNWTTSTILADLTGDGLPDIYDVNYVTDPDVFDRVCRHPDGSALLCKPSDFHAEPDRVWKNLGDGRFQDVTEELLGEIPSGMGLGVAAWDADGQGRLSLFVANDTTPSFFFRPESVRDGELQLRDRAIDAGLAFNGSGKATGSMGIALGHIDQDQRPDLLITNFYGESSTFFANTMPGLFTDETRRRGLDIPSQAMLGFGTQFIDVDLDGQLELFVSNGHVDDLSRYNRPYKMRPQLFQLDGKHRFVELPKDRIGRYFEKNWLGRPAARLDWNRDGLDDLVVGHLHDPTALLTNTTASKGNTLSLQLIGINSNRDAIGTRVEAHIGTQIIHRQLTAGDGYQCSNERRLSIGAGQATTINKLIINWPSGLTQTLTNLPIPTELHLREGQPPITNIIPKSTQQ